MTSPTRFYRKKVMNDYDEPVHKNASSLCGFALVMLAAIGLSVLGFLLIQGIRA